jgi:hypothetical protein
MRSLFFGPYGVRAGWRFLAYAVLLIALVLVFQVFAIPRAFEALRVPSGLTAYALLISEIFEGIAVFGATAVLAAFERQRIDAYGLPVGSAFGKFFWEGTAIGIVVAAVVALAMIASGAMIVHGLA